MAVSPSIGAGGFTGTPVQLDGYVRQSTSTRDNAWTVLRPQTKEGADETINDSGDKKV
jgi:hypothetical protein